MFKIYMVKYIINTQLYVQNLKIPNLNSMKAKRSVDRFTSPNRDEENYCV